MKEEVIEYLRFLEDKVLDKIPLIEKETYDELVRLSYGLLTSNDILRKIKQIDFIVHTLVERRMIGYSLSIEFGERLNRIIESIKDSMKV